jgi:extracellular factor (EF) 3-hydroxypalmitic acid methyl ester biosynthesis protein
VPMRQPLSSATPPHPHDPSRLAAEVGAFWRDALREAAELNLDVGLVLDLGLAKLASLGIHGPANREPSFAMWQEAGEILQFGWLQLRAREKPRGYAGDHEMLGAIYDQKVTLDPRGVAFDCYFLHLAAPQAVRNRMHLVRDRLIDTFLSTTAAPKIIVVGSGSALEIRDALQQLPESAKQRGEIHLIDLDPAAISEAEQNVRPHLGGLTCFAQTENLVRLPKKTARLKELADADLVICTGFFDYLEAAAASELLGVFWNWLRPGGQALAFNFAPWNSTRTYMEWIGNWYLIYRTRRDLAKLAALAGIPADCWQVSAESSGIDLLLSLKKPL